MPHWINNFEELARSPLRRAALSICEAGLDAIATERVVESKVRLEGSLLHINGTSWDLTQYRSVHVVGFGKASCAAAVALERILGKRIAGGIVISSSPQVCSYITTCPATHPLPSPENVASSGRIVALCDTLTDRDLVFVIVSGGGSAMLCWPAQECEQSTRLYEGFLRTGGTIQELNTVRKHISSLKGGGLARELYPATVVGLIFSDIPGDHPEIVASGPTYRDTTTVADAQSIIEKYQLGPFDLVETPKEEIYFRSVTNIVLVSNAIALEAMAAHAQRLGFAPTIATHDLYMFPPDAARLLQERATVKSAILAGGEFRLQIEQPTGQGGRNQAAALAMLEVIRNSQAFVALASDGLDNGDAAGAIIDQETATRTNADERAEARRTFNEYPLLQKTGDLVFTGSTNANVSDLAVLLTEE